MTTAYALAGFVTGVALAIFGGRRVFKSRGWLWGVAGMACFVAGYLLAAACAVVLLFSLLS